MAETFNFDTAKIKSIIQSNNAIKKATHISVQDFLTVQAEFLEKVNEIHRRLGTVEHVVNIFLSEDKRAILSKYQPLEEVQLAVCGYNNSGKTSFIHELLGLGDFLPAGEGAVTARIVQFSYTSSETACLVQHASVSDRMEIGDRIDLSHCFTGDMTRKTRTKSLRKLIREHLARPEDLDKNSETFTNWAKLFIEIRLPSPVLELGLHVYDTPGFLGSDSPVLRDNLLELVRSVHPTLVYLYDNAAVSDDSRKYYEALKEALHSQLLGVDIFFLNTKADVTVIRKNASNQDDDDDDERLLEKERLYRYKLLLDVDEMKGDINEANEFGSILLPSEQCQSFDIFSTVCPMDPMEKIMKRQAIDRIVCFAAEHDLRLTKVMINTILTAIDTFFDFVLITNRRSTEEWEKLRQEALQWGGNFFKQYRESAERIAEETNRRLPQRFLDRYDDIKAKVFKDCETRNDHWLHYMCSDADEYIQNGQQHFIDMLLERDVTKPVIQQIISELYEQIKQSINKEYFVCYRDKNELLYAAYQEILVDINHFGNFTHITIMNLVVQSAVLLFMIPMYILTNVFLIPAMIPLALSDSLSSSKETKKVDTTSALHRRQEFALNRLKKFRESLPKVGPKLQKKLMEWIEDEHGKFSKKVNGCFKMVCRTIEDRARAYELTRLFSARFARIECRLQANIDLAKHYGSHPIIDRQVVLGTGGFFTVHPAVWDNENALVAKILREHITNQDFAYMEAHFHRILTHLNVPHMIQLKYLYEENNSSLCLILPRYDTNLHSFLLQNMKKMTADKAIQIVQDIAKVIAQMHAHDLVHRDIKVQNILMNKEEQVFLADFGTCQHGTENNTFIGSRPLAPDFNTTTNSTSSRQYSYQGTEVDVYALGMLMYACAPKDSYVAPSEYTYQQISFLDRQRVPERYCQLITRCLDQNSKQRPTAKQIVDELEAIAKQLCIICEEAPRFVRFEPCGHKAVCIGCLERISQKNSQRQCFMCNQIYTSTREDNSADTFFVHSTKSV